MIAVQQLTEIADHLQHHWQGPATLVALRGMLPGVHLAWCMEDEIGADEPVVEAEQFNLYLIDGSNHCLTLTSELEQATGILIAEVDER